MIAIFYKKLDRHLFETGFFLDIEKDDEKLALMRKAFAKSKPSAFAWIGFILSIFAKLLSGHNDMTSTVKKFRVSQNKAFKSIA